MQKPNMPGRVNVEEIMQKIRSEIEKRKNLTGQKEVIRGTKEKITRSFDIESNGRRNSFKKLLWKYGCKYAFVIKKIPILNRIAEKQFWKIATYKKNLITPTVSLTHPQSAVDDPLKDNFYYQRFLEQIKKEGIKGKIKYFILKLIGFFADWQGKINKDLYREMMKLAERIEQRSRNTEELMNQRVGVLRAELTAKAEAQTVEALRAELTATGVKIKDHILHILDQERRLALFFEKARQQLPESLAEEQLRKMVREEDHLLDAMYVSFEDQFRGTREEIKQRLKVYLPYIEQSKKGTNDAPILDVGCGRGEWLELLRENGHIAKGIDINRVMVQQCKEQLLEVIEADVIEYLRSQKSNMLGAITGFQIVEHLPLKTLIALFDESLRVLKLGGIVIFETPNPQNLIVGACNFYTDPTHYHPIPAHTLKFLMESRGFSNIEKYCPNLEKINIQEKTINEFFNTWINQYPDYGLIGVKQ